MQEYIQEPKSNMATSEPSGPTKGRSEHHNPEDDENILKYNFMNMTETFKEEMKNLLKEVEEKTKAVRNQQNP